LDVRYFRDTTIRSTKRGRRYEPNPHGDILGEEQWAWLEGEIRNSDAQVHIIGSGIQFIAEEHGYEKWANFPKSRQRMLDLLVKHKPRNVMFLSGDRHIAEISRMEVSGLGQPLYDFTSSGLTHTWSGMPPAEQNQHRVSRFIVQKNFGMILIDWSPRNPAIRFEIRGKSNALWDVPIEVK
jgi:alkaline phosphatase D